MTRLNEGCTNPSVVLQEVKRRADWQRYQEAQKRREEEEAERERVSYAQIDWHDFVVVESVDYQPFEIGNFPPPTTPEEVGARILLQERYEEGQDVEMQLESDEEEDDEDEDSDREQSRPPPPPGAPPSQIKEGQQPPPVAPNADNVIVRKDYNPKAIAKPQARPPAPDEYLISPITGERIPASQVAEHMRIGLLDPRWLEQRDRQMQEKMTQESVYAPGSAIENSLRALAERRTDIFGVGDDETAIGKKIGEEERRKEEAAKWEGQQPPAPPSSGGEGTSFQSRPGPPAGLVTIQEQIAQIHKNKALMTGMSEEDDGLGSNGVVAAAPPKPPQQLMSIPPRPPVMLATPQPPPMMMMSMSQPNMSMPMVPPSSFIPMPQPMGMMQQQPQQGGREPMEEEPPSKRQRNEDQLMPEEAFLVRYPGLLHFHIGAPVYAEKPEWRLQGQQLSFSLLPTEPISVVKQKISEVTGMPPAKQKLFWEGLYFKDNHSLAFYNVTPDAVVQLQVKERGGRKK